MVKVWEGRTSEEKEKIFKKVFGSNDKKPNDTEIFVDRLLQKDRPGDFIYSGAGEIFIGGRCPDWFNVNGKKQVIELFGEYWHGEKHRKKFGDLNPNKEHELDKINHYKKYGYDCLIIWEHELKDPTKVIEKIRRF